ncbi:uncharacterized protein LOC107494716 [Arachis duranensis]|uniref:ATP-dependent DNA helicase n=1 Tax=Arachis duranensis TaxID=130453 RepID=A0A6P4DYU0_ARADU|nr:uncharacterized protein LOC107494716 [Arachis duranensis]
MRSDIYKGIQDAVVRVGTRASKAEYCNKSNAIKYLFKYVNKGPDRVAVGVTKEASSGEDAQRWPSVMRLTFYLPGEQNIIFKNDDDLEEIVKEEEGKCTMFLAWMEANKKFESGQILIYAEFPNQFVYDRKVRRGCTTYESIRTANGITYSSFQDACYSMGLLCDDREFITAINEKNLCLIEIEKILNSNARSLRDYQSMPYLEMSDVRLFQNKLIKEELAYGTNELTHTNLYTEQKMIHEQRLVFNEILNAVITDSGGFYFVYGHGGCSKTFIWNGLSSAIRSRGNIVLNVASSGIASLLLPGGRTTHSRFSIPITITDESTCNIKHGSLKAELLIQSNLIIWDEAPILNKMCFEALDRTPRDLMLVTDQHKTHQSFGSKVVVLGGDFRQILPVIPKGSRHDILTSTINSSHLWSFCKVLKLHMEASNAFFELR